MGNPQQYKISYEENIDAKLGFLAGIAYRDANPIKHEVTKSDKEVIVAINNKHFHNSTVLETVRESYFAGKDRGIIDERAKQSADIQELVVAAKELRSAYMRVHGNLEQNEFSVFPFKLLFDALQKFEAGK